MEDVCRSERYYIKQSEIETNITVKFILDASKSMDYKENGISKLQFSKVLIAALGYLAAKAERYVWIVCGQRPTGFDGRTALRTTAVYAVP
ncbi:MAG: hypothetical protein WDO15_18730 [Bacteroidota bacterium]